MRLLRLNINAPHDWRGDLTICVKAMRNFAVFGASVFAVTIAFMFIYHAASFGSQTFDVYSEEDLQLAINDPFVDTIILHDDINLKNTPNKKIFFIRDF